ncbi:MAG: TIGR04283 family arsenosugar biosynthesis glycosyltransferase [Vampirovibrio sp.]|nr:TIGR04283 family arsenosugar biosynthesis glycosyltransferase [Vampirovibrio sp.]
MISIIIPTLNETTTLPFLVDSLMASTVNKELIMVDGHSQDGTWEKILLLEKQHPTIQAIQSTPGRGQQLRQGVQMAQGDILFFLHADSQLDSTALGAIQETLTQDPTSIGGNFRLSFGEARPFYRFMNRFYAWIRRFGLYYGDSGIFMTRQAYDDIGGLKDLPIMEDYDLVRRMEQYGNTQCIQTPILTTSTRRFEGKNTLQLFWLWGKMHVLYALGASGPQLRQHYENKRIESTPTPHDLPV